MFNRNQDGPTRPERMAGKKTSGALRALHQHRAHVISKLSTGRMRLARGAMNTEVDKHAHALCYVDHAIASQSAHADGEGGSVA